MASAYDKKFAEMKQYIPFLETMIKRLENTGSTAANPRQAQLDKIRSLRDLLLDKKQRMKMENLLRCEQVLINLYAKVQQRDSIQDQETTTTKVAKPTVEKEPPLSKPKSDLEMVRNKLKTVTKIQEAETLPEIARANDVELQYTGNREPALFQRRPNKSPTRLTQISPSRIKNKSPQNQPKRNYTRVLISPDRSPRRWSSSERSISDKQLFNRRSPPPGPVSPPTSSRKEKKKSKSLKTKTVSIALNVPTESLKTLSEDNILTRILNCNDDEAELETFYEIRSRILEELKESGNNEDISSLILQSYKTSKSKKKSKKTNSKDDIEEGELSDSESEAIGSIYGSLPLVEKDKETIIQTKATEGPDKQHQKIQISLSVPVSTDKNTRLQHPVIDLSDEECDKGKDVISVDSDSSPNKKTTTIPNKQHNETAIVKNKMDPSTVDRKLNNQNEKHTECINIDDDIEVLDDEETQQSPQVIQTKNNSVEPKQILDTVQGDISVQSDSTKNDRSSKLNENQDSTEQHPKFIANFYKPIEDEPVLPETSSSATQNLPVANVEKTPRKDESFAETLSTSTIVSILLEAKTSTAEVTENNTVQSENKTTSSKESETHESEPYEKSQNIPLLDEPTEPPKAKEDVVSEIDILQALKNEILSESIPVPGAETTTPPLHQPNVLTKVASAQDILFPKKKITLEAYKEKTPNSKQTRRKPKIYLYREKNKKQSLQLTDKECERFQFPKRLSIDDEDDDDIDDIYRDDLTEDNVDSDTLNNLYSDFAPKSPDCEIINNSGTAPPPIIIPVDPVKNVNVNSKIDVDMRHALSQTSRPSVPPLQPPPLLSLMGINDIMTRSPAYDSERNRSDVQLVEPLPVNDTNKFLDPRIRRDTNLSVVNSPNPYATMNPERTPRSATYANVVSSAPNMALNRAGGMTPSMTPSYTPSVPQRMTPNPRMTPSHQTFELEEPASQKHVYAPSFSMCDNRERESSISRDGPLWDMNKHETKRSRRSRWEESNIPTGGPNWEMRDLRGLSNLNDGSRTPRHDDSYASNYEKYNDHTRHDKYSQGRRDTSYSKSDGPMTPMPSFGWSECPSTPGNAFGRQEAPMTPTHPFGRSDCPNTPVHPFGRADCPPTPSSGFGRNPDSPSGPSHLFGRSDGSLPHHFGRSESSSYTRPECTTNSNPQYLKDPRLNRRANEFERNREYSNERARKDLSYKPPSRHFTISDSSRNYERERSDGRSYRNCGDNNSYQYDRDRRDSSVGRTNSNDYENSRFRANNRQGRFDDRYSYHNDGISSSIHNQRERSASRTSNTYEHEDRSRSTARATSVGRSSNNERKDNISFKSDNGRNFTINTSVKSTFQNFQPPGDSKNIAENSFDARRQRAASVGRSLARENSVGRTLTPGSSSCSNMDIKERFKRASSVGRESRNTTRTRTLQEIKADFEDFKSKILIKNIDTHNTSTNSKNQPISYNKSNVIQSQCDRKTDINKVQYSPRKNYRDPRMRREQKDEHKSRYKIDRRSDSRNHKKTGIVYSNDNIAKGQIMGAGFGVKNYKIPKIKRPEPEDKAKLDEKKADKPCVESDKKSDATLNLTVNDKKSKTKEAPKTVEPEKAVKAKIKNAEKKDSGKGDEIEGRVTRSRKKSETKESKDVLDDLDVSSKTRKSKKSVIHDSDSDLENESGTKSNKKDDSPMSSPSKTSKVTSSPKTDKEQPTKKTATSLVPMDDMFSDNMPSDPIIDNINDLIADLDHDLNSSKVSNESFTHELDQIFDAVDSSENRLGDISEVIEKDLSESNEGITSSHLLSTNIVTENSQQNALSEVYPRNKTIDAQSISQEIRISKNHEESTRVEKSEDEPKMSNDIEIPIEKVNDNIVSTTDIDSLPKENREIQNVANSDDQSGPDSTINKITSGKPLPDSTIDDVTSTNENTETLSKGSEKKSAKEPLNQIGNLLSILQDKSKIKELLSMLGEQSNSENEKIKKKLEMLSHIVSDDEDDDSQKDKEGQKEKDDVKNVLNDAENDETSDITCDESQSVNMKERLSQTSNKTLPASKIEESTKSNISPDLDRIDETRNTSDVNKYVENESSIKDTCRPSKEITSAYESKSKSECADTSKKLVSSEVTVNKELSETTNEIDKNLSSEDDEPLVKKGTKKVKGTKVTGKNKPMLKRKLNKRTTRASAKTGVKKRGELQKLQEDIKEMFMSQDILNATGIRMCRLAKMVNEKSSNDSEAIVVLEKAKSVKNLDQLVKTRKKPGPKPKAQADKKSDSLDEEKMLIKPKIVPKNKPGPKSKTKNEDADPYEFETDSIADTSTTKDSDSDSSDSETSSLASSRSFGSSEALSAEAKKKPKRKRRSAGRWKSGIIKPRKKKEKMQESGKIVSIPTQPQTPFNIPDLHCFTDKSYCFQKGVSTYDCRLCVYNGKDIVKHFKEEHPHTEIPLSRLDQKTAELAIKQCEEENYLALRKVATEKYACRFCHKEFSNCSNVLETFFWHVVTNHTGEFKHLCPECLNITSCPFNLDIPPPPKEEGQLIGYICKKCNFTQISLKNLKTHVVEQHRDEETEVFTINLAVMTNKAMKAMLKRAQSKATVNRSLRSNHSAVDTSDAQDDSTDASEASSVLSTEFDTSMPQALSKSTEEIETEVPLQIPKKEKINTKLTFENDELNDDTPVKVEQDDTDATDAGASLHSIGIDDALGTETEIPTPVIPEQPPSQRSDSIMDYAHFKLNYTASGAKEYVCCINGNDGHYKTSLLISMKKHIQSKHSEKWDGYCCICRVLVTLQGVQSDFRDCLSHFLDKHMDDFPVLEKVPEISSEITNMPETGMVSAVAVPAAMVTATISARVATPPERTASPSYIAVRPLAELLCRDRVVSQTKTPLDMMTPPIALPRIECVVSLGNENTPPPASLASPRPGPAIVTDKPFLYEEAQAEVMSKKHRVVLDAMMSKESLVRVFKCAGRFCSFTTDSADEALMHASAHQRVGGEGALQCSYCNYDASDNGIDLVMHVFKEHGPCQYCCPLCFYRAAAPQLVHAHYRGAHAGAPMLKAVLRSTVPVPAPDPGQASLLPRDVAVQLYICNQDRSTCNFQTYISQKFVEHLQLKHANATSHPCNLCPALPSSAAELVIHLRAHGLRLYQCTWCVHGASSESEMLAHVGARHPHRQPSAYMRVITQRDVGKRVLPLAILNKPNVATEDVIPSATPPQNPVKEAERSIDLEKLIGHTMVTNEIPTDRTTEQPSSEEPDDVAENIEELDNDDPSPLEAILTTAETEEPTSDVSETQNALEKEAEAVVKTEPTEGAKSFSSSDVICLDSDEENDETEQEVTTVVSDTTEKEDVTLDKDGGDVASSSVTDEVSITKLPRDSLDNDSDQLTTMPNRLIQNVIDLSDEDPSAQTHLSGASIEPSIIIQDKNLFFKCPRCYTASKSAHALKIHVERQCSMPTTGLMMCPHSPCTDAAPDLPRLIAHYHKRHRAPRGRKQNFCGICRGSFSSLAGAKVHIRSVHKVTNYEVRGEKFEDRYRYYVVEHKAVAVRASARKTSTEIQRYTDEPAPTRQRKSSTESKKRYGIADIDKLPISPILDAAVFCELCEFGTKVRVNMVRHLQQHAAGAAPRTAPVNPVPHLETNEMHFDKMVNLASSSLGPTRPAPADAARYPRYVPDRARWACGARACDYTSLDAAMFRRHWDTLHAAEHSYRCPHCPPHQELNTAVPLSAKRILWHLCMHDASLYACSACPYYHFKRNMVEKHAADTHRGVPATVRVIREATPEPAAVPEPAAQTPTAPPALAAPTMDLKRWHCGLCPFSNLLRQNVVNHSSTEHNSKMQFKCSYCPFRTSTIENVQKHQSNVHPNKPEDVFYYFYKEGSVPELDGVPLWQKQRQKQGLDELKTEPDVDSETPTQVLVTPVETPIAIDLNIVKEEKLDEPTSTEFSIEELCEKFGEFCEPDGIKYKCCLCNAVRELARDTMQGHLYEELNYRRWECVICSYKAFHQTGLNDHMASEHSRQFNLPKALPTDTSIEKWVQAFLDHQAKIIETNLKNLSVQKIQGERTTLSPALKLPEPPKPTSSASDSELENAFGEFGAPKNQQYACPKCDFVTKDEATMVTHLESELSKIRWGCTSCSGKYTTFHEAQFHCKSAHVPPGRPKEAIRDPSLRFGWVKSVVESQKQFIKCISSNRELSPDRESEQSENSLLVAMYDEPVHIDERTAPTKRSAPTNDSDDERLVIDEPPAKKVNDRNCPYCEYSVRNSRYLREHILSHFNIKPYKCGYCSFDGTRPSVYNHLNIKHSDQPKSFITVEIPTTLPPINKTTQDAKEPEPVAKTSKRDTEEVTKKVCLYCEKSVPETEIESHTHGTEKTEFAKRGEVVVKCCKCLVLRLTVASLQDHFDSCHPGEKVLDNYAYFKLQVDTREIYCCGHCYKKFKFIRDLKAHHMATHTSLSLSYTCIPFSHNLHTEGDYEVNKRKSEDTAGPPSKKVARKSTSKLPKSAVAKKSTTKLPLANTSQEYSFYGDKPSPMSQHKNVTVNVPTNNSFKEMSFDKVISVVKVNPRVVLQDFKKY